MPRPRGISSELGIGFRRPPYRYVLVPWTWNASQPQRPFWRLPTGSVGGVDLRPLSAQAIAGGAPQGFAFAACLQSPGGTAIATALHMNETPTTAGMQSAWQSAMDYTPQGATLTDLLWDQLTTGSDPTGQNGPKPLVPGTDGQLRLYVGGHSLVKSERFQWGVHPHTNRLRDLLRRDFELRWEATNGDDHCRRCLDYTCKKYGVDDWKEFVPPRLHAHVPGRLPHATTYTDNFNRADEALDANANWAIVSGTWNIVSNRVTHTGAAVQLARWTADLSSSDNYCQAACDDGGGGYNGTCARFQSGADTAYLSEQEWSEDLAVLYKRVTGTNTSLGSAANAATPGTPVTLKCEANGTTIKVYANAVEKVSVTDTAVATGLRGGMWGFGTNYFDDWEAADLAAAGAGPPNAPPILPGGGIAEIAFPAWQQSFRFQ